MKGWLAIPLFQVGAVEEHAAQTGGGQSQRSEQCAGQSPASRLFAGELGSISIDPIIFGVFLSQGFANNSFQAGAIGFIECNEAKGLLVPGNRLEHLGVAEHGASLGHEHQHDARTAIQRLGHGDQTAGDRNDLQIAAGTAAVGQTKDGWR